MATWQEVLQHRDSRTLDAASQRLENAGLTPEVVHTALGTGFTPDLLDPASWTNYGGLWGVAALAQEIDAQAYQVRRQASAIRHAAIAELAEMHSIADIARELGQSRQAISKVANSDRNFQGIAQRILDELKGGPA